MENTALVRKTYDDADDAIWFDPTLCALDAPGIDACNRYTFVNSADDVSRVFLTAIDPVEVPVGTLTVEIPVEGVIYPATSLAEYSLDGESWDSLNTDTQARIDDTIAVPVDGTAGTKSLSLYVRPVGTENTVAVVLPLTINIVI